MEYCLLSSVPSSDLQCWNGKLLCSDRNSHLCGPDHSGFRFHQSVLSIWIRIGETVCL